MNGIHIICCTSNYILLGISGFIFSFFLFVLVWVLLPTHCKCKGLLLHFITLICTNTHTHTRTQGRTSLDEGSGRRRDRFQALTAIIYGL